MKVSEIQWRWENGCKMAAMKVKGYRFPKAYEIAEYLKIDDETAQELAERSWDYLADVFWNDRVPNIIEQVFGERDWCSAGKSNGWLCVDIDETNFRDVRKWSLFVKYVDEEIKLLSTTENVCEFIKANKICIA